MEARRIGLTIPSWIIVNEWNLDDLAKSPHIADPRPIGSLKGCLSNKTALAMIFKLAEAAKKSWLLLKGHNKSHKVSVGGEFADEIEVVRSQAQAAAAPSVTKFGD